MDENNALNHNFADKALLFFTVTKLYLIYQSDILTRILK